MTKLHRDPDGRYCLFRPPPCDVPQPPGWRCRSYAHPDNPTCPCEHKPGLIALIQRLVTRRH